MQAENVYHRPTRWWLDRTALLHRWVIGMTSISQKKAVEGREFAFVQTLCPPLVLDEDGQIAANRKYPAELVLLPDGPFEQWTKV